MQSRSAPLADNIAYQRDDIVVRLRGSTTSAQCTVAEIKMTGGVALIMLKRCE